MKKTTLIAGLAVVLASGIGIGAVGQLMFMHYRLARMYRLGPPGMRIHALERLSTHLQLDEKQRPELQELTDATIARMRNELTPDQQKSFQAAWEDFQKRHHSPAVPAPSLEQKKEVQP